MSDESRNEAMLEAIINDESYENPGYIQSRNEQILQSIIDDTPYTAEPESRIEELLLGVKEKIEQGGGGTYEELTVSPDFSSGNVTVEPEEGYDALSSVTIQKDADLVAGNIKKDVEIFGVTGTLDDASKAILDGLIAGTATNIESDATVVKNYAFYKDTSVEDLSFPNATAVGDYSFQDCSSLEEVDLLECVTVGNAAFKNCGIKEANFPKVTTISGSYNFSGCSELVDVNLPLAAGVLNEYIFNGCSKLQSIELPLFTTIGGHAFDNCTLLRSVTFPAAKRISGNTFTNDTALEIVDAGNAEITSMGSDDGIYSAAFKGCSNLSTLVFRHEAVFKLKYTSALDNTPFASSGTGGTLYVPQDKISAYQNASNWSTILGYSNNSIQAIEGSIYE